MNINFNTTIFALFGICFGETDLTGETEHCLQFFIAIVGISFVWFTQDQ
jgi:hypothetical protein